MQRIPGAVREVLKRLTDAGHEAWCVGGCVRDILLQREPDDWDVTTSALPEETLKLFGNYAVPTGLQHGTVTVRTDIGHVEVTTYRMDGNYGDGRHPDSVRFTRSLVEDLARRDFTVNAIAMNACGELRDPMGGIVDLTTHCLRCVREPDVRFGEDALRIMRGLRFSSTLGFDIEPDTAKSIHENRALLRKIAPERIRVELDKLLCGDSVADVLRKYPDVLGVFLPEILPAVGLAQNSRYHCYDVWEHTLHSVAAITPDPILRMAMLLHDLGKPSCCSLDKNGCGHFYGHPKVSYELAKGSLDRLKYDNESRRTILTLVERHDWLVEPTEKSVRRGLRVLGENDMRRLLEVKRADNRAQSVEYLYRQEEIDRIEQIMDALVAQDACFSLKQLAVNGNDLMAMGFRGVHIGNMLNLLLTAVVDGELKNDRNALLEYAQKCETEQK